MRIRTLHYGVKEDESSSYKKIFELIFFCVNFCLEIKCLYCLWGSIYKKKII
jgi:hypothetical protein